MKKLGVIINPIAGLGGSVGLKGTDNMVEEALARGAIPHAEERMKQALSQLLNEKSTITIYTGEGELGADVCIELGLSHIIATNISVSVLTAETTKNLCEWMQMQEVDLILFAGGDGTARDIYEVAKDTTTFLGVPAGVKIHSPVYALNATKAGELAHIYLNGKNSRTREMEVLDIDEELYRREIISTKLYGYLRIPMNNRYMQSRKSPTPISEEMVMNSIATRIIEEMEMDTFYIIGAGTTTRAIMNHLQLPNTLIGVDIIKNKKLIQNDVFGNQILDCIGAGKAKLVITVTGGQGFLFGRGNQQITPDVIRAIGVENIIIIATKDKLLQLEGNALYVDTGDIELDKTLSNYYRIIVSYGEVMMFQVLN